ncbi:MAG: hypothetical protein DMG14_00550 [Acidobacteria bacterium]|nr:MAG: hypothetical protein DMG14_00550 [Acidobacteriota bacterium]
MIDCSTGCVRARTRYEPEQPSGAGNTSNGALPQESGSESAAYSLMRRRPMSFLSATPSASSPKDISLKHAALSWLPKKTHLR